MNRTKRILAYFRELRQNLRLRLEASLAPFKIGALSRFVFIANILDAVLTLKWTEMQVAEEVNPLMAYLIEIDPLLFLSVKISAVTLSCLILWKLNQYISARIIAILSVLLYAGILMMHVTGAVGLGIVVLPTIPELRNSILESWDQCVEWVSTQILQ